MSAETDADRKANAARARHVEELNRPVPDWPCGYGCGWVGTHLRHAIAHEKKCRLGKKTEKTEAARVAIAQAERAVVDAAMAWDVSNWVDDYKTRALSGACAALQRVREGR